MSQSEKDRSQSLAIRRGVAGVPVGPPGSTMMQRAHRVSVHVAKCAELEVCSASTTYEAVKPRATFALPDACQGCLIALLVIKVVKAKCASSHESVALAGSMRFVLHSVDVSPWMSPSIIE